MGWAQAMAESWPAPKPLTRSPRTNRPCGQLQTTKAPPNHLHKQHNQRTDSAGTRVPLKLCGGLILICGVNPHTLACPLKSQPVLIASQLEGQTYPLMCQRKSRFKYNREAHKTHPLRCCTTGPQRTPATQGHFAKTGDTDLPNT